MSEATQTAPATGTFCWNELGTRIVAAAKTFFTKLLGWTTEEMDMGDCGTYTLFKQGETQVAGMYEMKGEKFDGVPPHWLSYISVSNVDEKAKKAEDLGATICVPPTDIPHVGRFAVVTDPSGATIALFQGSE